MNALFRLLPRGFERLFTNGPELRFPSPLSPQGVADLIVAESRRNFECGESPVGHAGPLGRVTIQPGGGQFGRGASPAFRGVLSQTEFGSVIQGHFRSSYLTRVAVAVFSVIYLGLLVTVAFNTGLAFGLPLGFAGAAWFYYTVGRVDFRPPDKEKEIEAFLERCTRRPS